MNRVILVLALIFSLTATAQQKARVAIYMTGNDPINEIVSNRLMHDLKMSEKYSPIERSAEFLAAIAKEQSFERSGEVDYEQIAALGKQFGLRYVCVGSIFDVWQSQKYFTVRIIDVNSARIIRSFFSFGTFNSEKNELMRVLDYLSLNMNDVLDAPLSNDMLDFPKIAVYVIKTGNRDVDIVLGDQLVRGFVNNEGFVAVERSNAFLKQLKKENGYQYSGMVDDNDRIAELGKQFGVQYVCVVKTISYGGSYFINARILNVETVEVKAVYNLENKTLNNIENVIDVASKIINELDVAEVEILDEMEIFTVVERDPEFPGGLDSLYRWISAHLKYPELAKTNNITGMVYATFVVERDGSISSPRILRSVPVPIVGEGFDEQKREEYEKELQMAVKSLDIEVIRVLKEMPRWKPGRQRGKPVRVQFNIPFNFNLM